MKDVQVIQYVDFSNWLCSQGVIDIVGTSNRSMNCPIAGWLNSSLGGEHMVDSDGSVWEREPLSDDFIKVGDCDEILKDFIGEIDDLGWSMDNENWEMAAGQATRILSLIIARHLGIEGYA